MEKVTSIIKMPVGNKEWSILTLSFFGGWMLSFPFEGQILYGLVEAFNFDLRVSIYVSLIAHFIGLILGGFLFNNIHRGRRAMAIVLILSMVGSLLFLIANQILWGLLLIFISFGGGIFVSSWGFFFRVFTTKKERIRTAADILILSNVFMILINFVGINLSHYIGLILSTISLIMSYITLSKITLDSGTDDLVSARPQSNPIKPLILLYFFITILTITSGIMYQVINPAFSQYILLTSWYWAVPYVITIYIIKGLPSKIDSSYILYVAIAMIGLSFISFIALNQSITSYLIVNTLMLGAFGIWDLFWWSVIGEMLEFSKNPGKIFGIGLSANVFGIFLGGFIVNSIDSYGQRYLNSSIIALTVVFITLIILPVLNKLLFQVLHNHVFLEKMNNINLNTKIIRDVLMKNYKLTDREMEIVELLLQGKTYKVIAGQLYVSENTVKTHIKNIYSKLNIKSKIELLKLVSEN